MEHSLHKHIIKKKKIATTMGSDARAKADEMLIPSGSSRARSQTRELADKVLRAAAEGRSGRQSRLDIAQLRTSELRLRGREDDLWLLRARLRGLRRAEGATRARPELLLITGASGTGKSALAARGLRDPARGMGVAFAGGKFDLNRAARPLSAFSKAMSSLADFVMASERSQEIRDGITAEFGEDDLCLLTRVMAGCRDLFPASVSLENEPPRESRGEGEGEEPGAMSRLQSFQSFAFKRRRRGTEESQISRCEAQALKRGVSNVVDGKEAVMRLQYAIRRLLKVICSNLEGVVLFIDDLQVRAFFKMLSNAAVAFVVAHPFPPPSLHRTSGVTRRPWIS